MLELREFRDRFKGRVVTMVGSAVTTVNYRDLAGPGPENVVLINWALGIAPLFRWTSKRLWFWTWHMEAFAHRQELLQPCLTPAISEGSLHLVPSELAERSIVFRGANVRPWGAYAHLLADYRRHGGDYIDETGDLPSCANSTLLALMFVWHGGCREINAVGMHDIGGVQQPHYDPRLAATGSPCVPSVYVQHLEGFCDIMGMKINYLGRR